jgi:2-hydroxychromene-2-carboxylate isomerase
MPAPIDFHFDFSSPYGCLAAQRIDALAAKFGRGVDRHPMLLGVAFKATGMAPLAAVAFAAKEGVDAAAARAAIDDPAIKDALRQEVAAAIARGVFGSPFVFVDGEPFRGFDRFDQIERWLATGGF